MMNTAPPLCPEHGNNGCLLYMDEFIKRHCTEEQKSFVASHEQAIVEYVRPLMKELEERAAFKQKEHGS